MESIIQPIFKQPIKICLYNIIDCYSHAQSNVLSLYVFTFLKLFEGEQNNLIRGIKTAVFYLCLGILQKNSYLIAKTLSIEIIKHRRVGQLFRFFFKIIREVFTKIPLLNRNNCYNRAEYLKIQISGKIDGEMRAVKKIYSFSKFKGKEIPIQTLNLDVNYSLVHCKTFAGVLGIKV